MRFSRYVHLPPSFPHFPNLETTGLGKNDPTPTIGIDDFTAIRLADFNQLGQDDNEVGQHTSLPMKTSLSDFTTKFVGSRYTIERKDLSVWHNSEVKAHAKMEASFTTKPNLLVEQTKLNRLNT